MKCLVLNVLQHMCFRSLKTTLTTHSQIELSWDQPIMTSYQIDPNPGPIWYTVHCSQPQPQCNGLQYIETNETRITIDKLQADTSFTWRVCAENAVSKFIQSMSNCETLKVATLKMGECVCVSNILRFGV